MSNFPELYDTRSLRIAIDDSFGWLVSNYGQQIEVIFLPVLHLLMAIQDGLLWLPWYVVIGGFVALGWVATRSAGTCAAIAGMLFLTGFVGLWEPMMTTIALMLTATLLAVVIGIPIGIAMSRSGMVQAFMLPVLDVMQTMPIFVYLIPFVMLFGPGQIPALLATLVFALPPVIRLTNLGIRHVDSEVIEAVTAFGATPRQRLLTVQFPLAMPTILAGVNQTTMLALSMVVIAALIGGGGLGYQVLQGIQRLELSRGLFAGIAIVFLAIILDRIAQGYGKRMQKHLKITE